MTRPQLVRDARQVTDDALAALWSFYNRPKSDGSRWQDIDGIGSVDEYRAVIAERPGKLAETCRMALTDLGLTPEEVEALKQFLELEAATELAHRGAVSRH